MSASGSADSRLEAIRDILLEALSERESELTSLPDQVAGDTVAELLAVAQQLRATTRAVNTTRAKAEQRLNELMEVIVALVSFDYARKAAISDTNDVFDGMAAGLNMLGEELSVSTVSRAHVTNILESMDDAVFVVDAAGVIATANGAAGKLAGCPDEHLLGQPLSGILPGVAVGQLLDTGGARDVELVLSRGSEAITASLSASVLRDRGKTDGLVCVVRDVTQSKRLDAERWRLREAVQRQAVLVEELPRRSSRSPTRSSWCR
ncbi:PAS domain-containing protein [Enhygromyxa salina]|uniref:Sensory histidine kinase AtoS n=1 Tax=Enhygromyxa salina TaxID=215803 RepID=A0A2S9XL61_9BACT|nr:PAS domain-containing protein [Enhygromyxa salina]PRP93609.1 sensory histidine kinase AtoS [Enhygromyxa salina]